MPENPIDLTPDRQKKLDEINQINRDKEVSDLRAVLQTPEGRRVFWRILDRTGWMHDPFVSGSVDITSRNTGKQSIGLWIFSEMLEAKPESFTQLQREHKNEIIRRARQLQEIDKQN